jgi:hypothetical protein
MAAVVLAHPLRQQVTLAAMARPLAMVAVVEPLAMARLPATVEMERFLVVAGDLVADP